VPYTERGRAEACGNIELTFYDLLDQLHTGHDAPCVEEALEAEHWTHAAFYPPVILFDNIVQVGQVRIWTGFSHRQLNSLFMPKAAWVASKPSRVITLGLAVALESLTEDEPDELEL
jgi:hypothetical protein